MFLAITKIPTKIFGGKPQIRYQLPKNVKEQKITTPSDLITGLHRESDKKPNEDGKSGSRAKRGLRLLQLKVSQNLTEKRLLFSSDLSLRVRIPFPSEGRKTLPDPLHQANWCRRHT
ncbi:hypothetical protein AVEN_91058-1 [Araneus ventricosus]|uniref:Uncharacterized protein n=1 Tax=Araneus ventricosus TaxID=182803 RepID=A0A4Y2KT82_ARAVE|nr:hypothetical protein AVEN_91058-1 [Araneus ventricosus]